MEKFTQLLTEHLKPNMFEKDPSWGIRPSRLGGRGLFANRDIQTGEIIFKDSPVLIGPRANKSTQVFCVSCYRKNNLRFCLKKCGLPVCSKECENSPVHKSECQLIRCWKIEQEFSLNQDLVKCLTPIRALLLADYQKDLLKCFKSHGSSRNSFEVNILKEKLKVELSKEEENFLNFICSVLDTNAFQVVAGDGDPTSLRGIYPLSSMINHSCLANTTHYFDSNQNMIVKAATFIPKDQEILHCYTMPFWGTYTRQPFLLRTKFFFCTCERCQDPSEFGTDLNAINCLKCKGLVLPVFVENFKLMWRCTCCKEAMPADRVGIIMTMLGNHIDDMESSTPEEVLRFLKGRLLKFAPSCNQIAVQLKCGLIWKLGHVQNYFWDDLSTELLDEKENICRELLQLLVALRTGKSKMRGLVLYELYCCLRERQRRIQLQEGDDAHESISEEESKEMESLFQESKEILVDDVHAPAEIKYYSSTNREKSVNNNDEVSLAG